MESPTFITEEDIVNHSQNENGADASTGSEIIWKIDADVFFRLILFWLTFTHLYPPYIINRLTPYAILHNTCLVFRYRNAAS